MKKIIIALAFTTFGLTGAGYAATSGNTVPVSVKKHFNQQFADAIDVKWEAGKTFFKATFEDWGRTLFAFYAGNGDLMGVATNLSSSSLPVPLQTAFKQSYSGYWVTDLFRFHNSDEHGYVLTLENADQTVVLKAAGDDEWTVYKTTAKN
jgi:hypothetical protein